MPTFDPETTVTTRIWDILNGWPPFANMVVPANQIRYDQVKGDEFVDNMGTLDSDYPRAELRPKSGRSTLHTDSPTFATHAPEGESHWTENWTGRFDLILISDLLNIGEPDALRTEAIAALRSAGVRLGTTWVTEATIEWRTERTDLNEQDRTVRWRSEIEITVRAEVDGASLDNPQPLSPIN